MKNSPIITFALLFGSRANSQNNSQSDYDIAILADNRIKYSWGVLSKAYNDIGEVLNIAEYDYDVVNLEKADELIKY